MIWWLVNSDFERKPIHWNFYPGVEMKGLINSPYFILFTVSFNFYTTYFTLVLTGRINVSSFIPPSFKEKWDCLIPLDNLQGKMEIDLEERAFYFIVSAQTLFRAWYSAKHCGSYRRACWDFSVLHKQVTLLNKRKLSCKKVRSLLTLFDDTLSDVKVLWCWIWELCIGNLKGSWKTLYIS
jgi:hypothetical protein